MKNRKRLAKIGPSSNPKVSSNATYERLTQRIIAGEWRNIQCRLELDTKNAYESVLQTLTRKDEAIPDPTCGQSETDQLLAVGHRIALFTKSFPPRSHQSPFARMIVLSYCDCLVKKKLPLESVKKIIATFHTGSEYQHSNLLSRIRHIHNLIIRLVRAGWDLHRATELVYLMTISDYDLERIQPSLDKLVDYFSTKAFVEQNYDACLTPHFTIPGFIFQLLKLENETNILQLSEIYSLLGYHLPNLPLSVCDLCKVDPPNLAHIPVVEQRGCGPRDYQPRRKYFSRIGHTAITLPWYENHCNVLAGPEKLLSYLLVYFEHCCRNMNFNYDRTVVMPNGVELSYDLCSNFDSYCFTATMFEAKNSVVEFRHAIARASDLIPRILGDEHPLTLACFFEVFLHFMQSGLFDVNAYFLRYIKAILRANFRKDNAWTQLWRLLTDLDKDSFGTVVTKAWECMVSVYVREFGRLHPHAISLHLDFIKRVYRKTNPVEEERILRHLLTAFGSTPYLSTPRIMLNLAHNLSRQGDDDKAKEIAFDVNKLLQEHQMYAGNIVQRIESLKIISHGHFNQGLILEAEETMNQMIGMVSFHWGMQHSWVSEFKTVLEDWLRRSGREKDADILRREVEFLLEKDDVDGNR